MSGSDDENVRLENKITYLEKKRDELQNEILDLKSELEDTANALERYKLIADFAHDWELWFRPGGSLEYVSPSSQSITGYASGEIISNDMLLDEIVYPDDRKEFRAFIKDALNFTGIRRSLNFRLLTRTKQIRWCEIKCRAVYDSRGKYLGQRASINDVTPLMQALGEIRNLSAGKEYDARVRDRYLRELEDKDRELVSQLVAMSNKNETLQFVKNAVTKHLDKCSKEDKEIFIRIIDQINSTLVSTDNWDNFMLHFEKIHPGFFTRLMTRYPSLTNKDLKLCSYLRLQMATKDIAGLMNITVQSAEISRVRLRKKMGLNRKDKLVEHILKI